MTSKKAPLKKYINSNTRIFVGFPIFKQLSYEVSKDKIHLLHDIMISSSEQVISWKSRRESDFEIEDRCRVIILTNWQYKEATGEEVQVVPVKKNHKLINGLNTTHTPVGYCNCNTHKGYLSTTLLKQHECLQKQCPFLEAFETHEFWREKERKKQRRGARKAGDFNAR